jgi:hypothetical protein
MHRFNLVFQQILININKYETNGLLINKTIAVFNE